MKPRNTIAFAMAAMACQAGTASGALITSTWSGGSTGVWNVAGNWEPSGVPNNGTNTFDVVIDGNSSVSVNVTLNTNVTITSLTIDANDALSIANNYDLRVVGSSFVNNGLLTIDATSNYTQFHAGTDLTISGSGAIALGSSTYNRIVGTAYGNRLTNGSAHTISGGGQIGADVIHLTNHGLIDADQPQELVVDLNSAATNYNDGIMQASDGATMRVLNSSMDNTGGLLQALDGSAVLVQNSTISGGEVSTSGSGAVGGWGDAVFSGILNSGVIHGANNTNTYFSGTITNNGQIALASTGNYTQAVVHSTATTTFQGSGEIVMGSDAHNRLVGSAYGLRLVNAAGHTIRGGGAVGADVIVLTNEGMIQADAAVELSVDLNSAAVNENNGVMQAVDGATMHVINSAIDNSDGVIRALDGSTVLMQNAVITGGEITTEGAGEVRSAGSTTYVDILNNGAIVGPNNTDTYFKDTITNNGVIRLAGTTNYTQLYLHGSPTTFNGDGEIVLGPAIYNRISGSAYGYRLVNAASHTIRGGGALGVDVIVLSNAGLIQADTATPLTIDLNAVAVNDNTGTMQASGGGTLKFLNTILDNTGGVIRALDDSIVEVQSSTIRSGELASAGGGQFRLIGDAQLEDLLNSADVVCPNNTNSYIRNTITNNGTILIDATVNFTQLYVGTSTATLAGDNTLILGNSGYNRIGGQAFGYRLVNGPAHTIRGAGNIAADTINVTNQGAIIADLSTGMTIDPNTEFLNEGTLHVTGAGGVTIQPGAFINSGQVTIDATRTLTRHQHYTQTGGETLVNGTLTMASGGTMQLQGGTLKGTGTISGPVTNSGAIVEPGTSVGTLNVNGMYTQTTNGTLRVEIGGTAAGAFDVLSVASSASLGGALEIVSTGGFTPAVGNTFTILTASSITGGFGAVNGNGQYCVTYSPTAVTVTVVSPCDADIVCDRQINVSDLLAVIGAWGACPTWPTMRCVADIAPIGPPLGDGQVNVTDLLLVIGRWGPCP